MGKNSRVKFVSFSGIDGAGKSTQIENLRARLKEFGLRVELIKFWDDVATLTAVRETTGHKVFKGDKGVGSPSSPVNRRDKNVQSPVMTGVRLFLYFLDAVSVRLVARKALRSDADFVIFDRYTYDEFANLNLRNPAIRAYIRLVMTFVPKPDVSYVLDADPVKARERKPEYPLEFLHRNRQAYLTLSELVGGMTVIAPNEISAVKRDVVERALMELSLETVRRDSVQGQISGKQAVDATEVDAPQVRPAAF